MGRLIQVGEAEAHNLRAEVSAAYRRLRKEAADRKRFQDAYNREKLGNEKDGRCDLIASDVHDRVESQHPNMLRRFLATDPRVAFKGPDPTVCKIAKVLCREAIYDQDAFLLFSDALKDGAISDLGLAKVFWRRIWGEPETKVSLGPEQKGLTLEDLEDVSKSGRFKILKLVAIDGPEIAIGELPKEGPEEFDVDPGRRYAAIVRARPIKESGVVIEGIPSEEWVHEAGKRRMDDRKGCGQFRQITVGEILREQDRLSTPGNPYFRNLAKALAKGNDGAPVADTSEAQLELEERLALHYDPDAAGPTNEGPGTYGPDKLDLRAKRWICEWNGWVVDGQRLVPAITTWIGSVIVRCEENEEGIVPYVHWSPITKPHSLIGSGLGRLHSDEQDYHTQLLRAFEDSVAYYIDQVLLVDPNGGVDELGLQDLWPGKVVHGTKDSVTPLKLGEPNMAILQGIELLKGDADERGPSTRLASMGTDMPNYNKTATAYVGFSRAAMNKGDVVALSFAETFLAPLYTKVFFLHQRNMDKPRLIKVDGKEIEVTREMIQGDYRAHAEIGLDVDFDDREASKAASLIQMLMLIANKYPQVLPVTKAAELARRLVVAYGEPTPGDLVELEPAALMPAPAPASPAGAPALLPPAPAGAGADAALSLSPAASAQPAASMLGQ